MNTLNTEQNREPLDLASFAAGDLDGIVRSPRDVIAALSDAILRLLAARRPSPVAYGADFPRAPEECVGKPYREQWVRYGTDELTRWAAGDLRDLDTRPHAAIQGLAREALRLAAA